MSDWPAPFLPYCKATLSAAQNAADGVWTVISWDAEEEDTDSIHSTVTNPTRFTANTPGVYACVVNTDLVAGTTGRYLVDILKNAAGTWAQVNVIANQSADIEANFTVMRRSVTGVTRMAVGDYLEVAVFQSAGITKAIGVGTGRSNFVIYKIGS